MIEHRNDPRLPMEADLPRMREIVEAAYGKYVERMDRPPAPVLGDLRPHVQAGQLWVIGQPITGLICLIPTEDGLLVENVAVHPDVQGTGLGRQLLVFAEKEAHRRGFQRIWLYTNEVMVENVAIYAHIGYREFDRRAENGYRRVFMAKALRES